MDEKQELLQELTDFKGTIYVPVRTDESAGDADPYIKADKDAVIAMVEQKGSLWELNPLCGGSDALLKPVWVPAPSKVG